MTNYSLQQEMDKVASQLAGVEAQFQTALDRLVETHIEVTVPEIGNIDKRNAMDKEDVTAEHIGEDPNYNDESMALCKSINEPGWDNQEEGLLKISTNTASDPKATKILSKGMHNQTPNTEVDLHPWQTNICANTENIKAIYQPPQPNKRAPSSNVTIIRITASKPKLSTRPTSQSSTKVRIECGGEHEHDDMLVVQGDISQVDKALSRDNHYNTVYHSKNLSRGSYDGSEDNANDVIPSEYGFKSKVKSVEENELETTNVVKCLISDQIDNPMTTCTDKFIRRTKSVLANNKDQVEVFQLKQHCRSLEGELDEVKSEIVKILSEKNGFLKENGMLKDLRNENESLKEENKRMRVQIQELIQENQYLGSPDSSQDNILLQLPDRSSPDGQEIETVLKDQSARAIFNQTGTKNNRNHESVKDEQLSLYEDSLEMMKLEFEEMEKYWISKLNSERKFYEEHLHQSELKFNELEHQIQSFVNFIENENVQENEDNEAKDTKETLGKLPTIKE